MTVDIISCILGGGALITLITFLIKRADDKKEKNDAVLAEVQGIKKQIQKMERDSVRTQLLMLMNTYQYGDASEILTVAEYYFKGLKGDWYMTDLFSKWCSREGVTLPPWFKGGEHDD